MKVQCDHIIYRVYPTPRVRSIEEDSVLDILARLRTQERKETHVRTQTTCG